MYQGIHELISFACILSLIAQNYEILREYKTNIIIRNTNKIFKYI